MRRLLVWTAIGLSALGPVAGADRLDTTLVVVLGGGLSAGFSGFRVGGERQVQAWPSQAARQMGTVISVATIRESGQAGVVNAFRPSPGLLPLVPQSGERALPFPFFALNLSVPFLKVGDALRLRPRPLYDGHKMMPAIEGDLLQTLVNATLGGPLLTLDPPLLMSQVESAEWLSPTLVFVQLGFEDVLDAALTGLASRITPEQAFAADYGEILRRMAATHATVVAMTVPDPTQTAYFTSVPDVARIHGLSAEEFRSRFGVTADDLITLGGLVEIGDTLRGRRSGALSSGSVLPAAVANSIRSAVRGYNNAIRSAATANGATVFDLGDFLRVAGVNGARAGAISVGGSYGGGFYSEDGLFPSPTGQALIANAILQGLNSQFGASFAPVDAEAVALRDELVGSRGR